MRRYGLIGVALVFASVAAVTPDPAGGDEGSVRENLSKVADLPLGWTSEIAFDDRWAYVYGASLWIVDRQTKQVVGTLDCPGADHYPGEVELVAPGWIAIDKTLECGVDDSTVVIVDVRDPTRPVVAATVRPDVANHTLTGYPGQPFLYVSPNGCCGDWQGGIEQIIDLRDPLQPELHAYRSEGLGCHDVGFVVTEDVALAACAAGSETQLWDVSDPLRPVTIARVPTPYVFFNHSAGFSDDAQLLVVGDEAHGANSCTGTPTGALWIYDISDPSLPVLVGTHGNRHGSAVSSFWVSFEQWCTAHMYDFEPGTHRLATAWYQGGVNVIDLADPTLPRELGYYLADEFFPWAAYWIDGEIWTSDTYGWCSPSVVGCVSDTGGGVEVFRLTEPLP